MNKTVKAAAPSYGTDGSFTATLSGLTSGQKYYFRAYAVVNGTESYASQEKTVEASSYGTFAMPAASQGNAEPAVSGKSWLELPGVSGKQDYVGTLYDGSARNYTYNYDKETYTSLWIAYPLATADKSGNGGSDSWKKVSSGVPESAQIDLSSSYGVNDDSTTPEGYDDDKEYYSRGHQVPKADRKKSSTLYNQTFYSINSTPQIQKGFNGSIWNTLEGVIRDAVPANDTLYIVTGAAFQKKGEPEMSVKKIYPKKEYEAGSQKWCPVPNFYWKVVLKVKRDSNRNVTSASAIGYWMPHEDLRGKDYLDYAVSVDQIEQWTGFDFFVNLPDNVEATAETNSNWSAFQNF